MRSGLHNIGSGFVTGRAPNLHTIGEGFVRRLDSGAAGPDANTIFQLSCDGADASTSFPDDVGVITWAAGGSAQVDTALQKFGTGSMMLETAGDTVSATHASLVRGTGDFTFDCWARFSSVASISGIFGNTAGSGFNFHIRSGGILSCYITGAGEFFTSPASTVTTGVWYHLAFERAPSSAKIYLDGTEVASSTSATWNTNLTASAYAFGRDINGNNVGVMQLDECRLSNVIRWGSNFTPPTAAY